MKYPIGIQDFEDLQRNGYAYVDKTNFVYKLADEGKYYFLIQCLSLKVIQKSKYYLL